jgi:hypothetical protein
MLSLTLRKQNFLTSDDLKEVGNIALEGQKMPQKAERLRNVILAALRSGTNPNQFDAILPDLSKIHVYHVKKGTSILSFPMTTSKN